MEWPREGVMLTLFGVYCRERITVDADGCWLSAKGVRKSYLVPAETTDTLLSRGWVRFTSDEWDAPLDVTYRGQLALWAWFRSAYPKQAREAKSLVKMRAYFTLRPMDRVMVAC